MYYFVYLTNIVILLCGFVALWAKSDSKRGGCEFDSHSRDDYIKNIFIYPNQTALWVPKRCILDHTYWTRNFKCFVIWNKNLQNYLFLERDYTEMYIPKLNTINDFNFMVSRDISNRDFVHILFKYCSKLIWMYRAQSYSSYTYHRINV